MKLNPEQQKVVNSVRDLGLPMLAAYVAETLVNNNPPELIADRLESAANSIRIELARQKNNEKT